MASADPKRNDRDRLQDWACPVETALTAKDDVSAGSLFCPTATGATCSRSPGASGRIDGATAIVPSSARRRHACDRPVSPRPAAAAGRVARAGTPGDRRDFRFETAEGAAAAWCASFPTLTTAMPSRVDTAPGSTSSKDTRSGSGHRGRRARSTPRDFCDPLASIPERLLRILRRDPAVLVVGGRTCRDFRSRPLAQLQVDTLIVDRERRIGDNWRNRYHRAGPAQPSSRQPPALHTISAELRAYNREESSPRGRGLCGRHGAQTAGPAPNSSAATTMKPLGAGRSCSAAPTARRARCIRGRVWATGVSGIPILPDIATLGNFAGTVLTRAQVPGGRRCGAAKRAIIIGSGNSGTTSRRT